METVGRHLLWTDIVQQGCPWHGAVREIGCLLGATCVVAAISPPTRSFPNPDTAVGNSKGHKSRVEWDSRANLKLIVGDEHPIDQQLDDPPTAGEIERVQARTKTSTQDIKIGAEFRETEVLLVLRVDIALAAPASGCGLAIQRGVF